MNKKDLEYFATKLKAEKAELEHDLAEIGERNPQSAGGWDATSGGMEVDNADENEVADKLEQLDENTGIATQLEKQLNEVKAALTRIEKGTYGNCEKCGKEIERGRVEANPSARVSIKHKH